MEFWQEWKRIDRRAGWFPGLEAAADERGKTRIIKNQEQTAVCFLLSVFFRSVLSALIRGYYEFTTLDIFLRALDKA
jgi:hypothetical protein